SAGATGAPSASPSAAATPSSKASVGASPSASSNPRPGANYADPTPSPTTGATKKPKATATPSATAPAASPSASPTAAPTPASIDDPLAWQQAPDDASVAAFTSYVCPKSGAPPAVDDPKKPLITCDEDGNKYLLSIAMIQGTQLKSASYGTPQGGVGWAVDLSFKSSARKTFATVTQELAGTGRTFAIVLDGKVLSAPQVTNPILDGNAQITGTFTQAEAKSLSNSLKFGALPIKFDQPTVETVGPSLAGDQLTAGVLAGIVGLLIVMIYCLLYYRGLGVVVIASLVVAAATTYAVVLLLAKTAGFTLTLPGIAGLIVAVGITADSFIVYFERIRDEMRTGKSMRVAVELGWARARNTCLAADAVSFLAALVLYIFTIGVVKGFAFALGISTIIDLAVFFWFTKPSMTLLAKRRFFSSGSRFSGLSPETLGTDQGHHSLGAGVSAGTVGRSA
ncbi:MAG: protein-export rane protein SecD, partial [Nocardioidaceae bacterium]|nr:protein-export rane protein SecD [Nocardioidaceae bacterium]